MNYKLSRKKPDTGKWWTYGSLKNNQWGNLQASFKKSALQELIDTTEGDWINLSAFEDTGEKKEFKPVERKADTLDRDIAFEDTDIPF